MARQWASRDKAAARRWCSPHAATTSSSAVAAQCETLGAQDAGASLRCRRARRLRRAGRGGRAGFGRIDALVNNAGISAQALLDEVADLHWYEDLMKINLWGSVWCTHAALPHLMASRGRIVAVSSLAGLVGVPGRTAYSAHQVRDDGILRSAAGRTQGRGVSVTIAYPGVVATRSAIAATTPAASPPASRAQGRRRDERRGMRAAHRRRHERAPARGGDDRQGQARPLRQADRAGRGRAHGAARLAKQRHG